jgi:hypothetical protein
MELNVSYPTPSQQQQKKDPELEEKSSSFVEKNNLKHFVKTFENRRQIITCFPSTEVKLTLDWIFRPHHATFISRLTIPLVGWLKLLLKTVHSHVFRISSLT